MGICLSVEGTSDTPEEIEPFGGSIGRCRFDCGGDSEVHRVPDVERASTDASLGDTTEGAALIVALKAILVACADNEVRQQPPSHKAPLTNKISGIYRCAEEMDRQSGLIRYAIIPLPCVVLTSFQRAQGNRETTVEEAGVAGACRPHRKQWRCVQASRGSPGENFRLSGLSVRRHSSQR